MFDKDAYHKEYRQKRKEDPEKYEKYRRQVSQSIKSRYARDEEFRAKVIQRAKDRHARIYAEKKAMKLAQAQAVEASIQ